MGTLRQVYHPTQSVFPPEFPGRLARFKEASGLGWRSIARLMRLSLHRLGQWRNKGAATSPAHPFLLLNTAEGMDLRNGILMCIDLDIPNTPTWRYRGDDMPDRPQTRRTTSLKTSAYMKIGFSARQKKTSQRILPWLSLPLQGPQFLLQPRARHLSCSAWPQDPRRPSELQHETTAHRARLGVGVVRKHHSPQKSICRHQPHHASIALIQKQSHIALPAAISWDSTSALAL